MGFFGIVTMPERILMARAGIIVASERDTLVQVHSVIGKGRKFSTA
jgi:hypothetical protein